jgi:hypothetical protein
MTEYCFILPEEQEAYLDNGWTIVSPGKVHGYVWSVIASREVAEDEA